MTTDPRGGLASTATLGKPFRESPYHGIKKALGAALAPDRRRTDETH